MKRQNLEGDTDEADQQDRKKRKEDDDREKKEGNISKDEWVGPALKFCVKGHWGKARSSVLTLRNTENYTPMFMCVGTQGTVKGLLPSQLVDCGAQVILANTYHLGHRPGPHVLSSTLFNNPTSDPTASGIQHFMRWPRALLTDSGGFQMVSLLHLAHITEEGVKFRSPHDGTEMVLTPEKSISLQNQIGSDIMMALDDVVSTLTTGPRVEEAVKRTVRWLDRCIAANKNPNYQNLFGIVQGGLEPDLRHYCLDELVSRNLPGYAIGGLSGGESKDSFWRTVDLCTDKLPWNKPRYLMGVGYPVDLVVCSVLGVDMFDCVYPSRTARFGTALVPSGLMHLKSSTYESDHRPIDETCSCLVCKKYTRSYLQKIAAKESHAGQLLTIHNLTYLMTLMKKVHTKIKESSSASTADAFPEFVKAFMLEQHPKKDYPSWVVDALASAKIQLF